MSDDEAEKLSYSDQYQRMRFQRELEAEKFLRELRLGLAETVKVSRTRYRSRTQTADEPTDPNAHKAQQIAAYAPIG